MFANDNVCVETIIKILQSKFLYTFANDNVCVETLLGVARR